jgi:hypothetical protein
MKTSRKSIKPQLEREKNIVAQADKTKIKNRNYIDSDE